MNKYCFGFSQTSYDGFSVQEHRHSCYELVYHTTCSGIVKMGGKEYKFQKGCVIFTYPHVSHQEIHTHGGNFSFIGFETDFDDLPPQGVFFVNNEKIPSLLSDILSEARLQQRNFDVLISAKISEILVELSRTLKENKTTIKDISHVKNHIDEYYNTKVDFNLLAYSCGYSYSTLRHKFSALYGISPQKYLIEVRLKNAYELLKKRKYNCTEICYRCGFSNSSQFAKMFKQRYGISPKKAMASLDSTGEQEDLLQK